MINQHIGRFQILAELGHGAFGTVYRALDTALNVERAIKILNPLLLTDRRIVDDFYREAQVVAGLRHANIVAVHDVLNDQGRLCIVMDLMPGGSLADKLAKDGPMTLAQTMPLLRQIADALTYAHEKGMVHCDIKPQNILFDERGAAHLSDFGLARSSDGASTAQMSSKNSGQNSGTLAYMAPELFDDAKPTPASDVYALACVVHEMLTGKVLFEGSTLMAVMKKHAAGADLSAIPDPRVREALAGALRAQPGERVGLQELETALEEGLKAPLPLPPVSAQPAQPFRLKPYFAKPELQTQNKKMGLVLAAGLLVLLCGGGLALFSRVAQIGFTNTSPTALPITLYPTATYTPTNTVLPTVTLVPASATPQPTSTPVPASPTLITPTPTTVSKKEIPFVYLNNPAQLNSALTWYQGNLQNTYALYQNPVQLKMIAAPQTDLRLNANTAPLVIYSYTGDFETNIKVIASPSYAYQFAGIGVRSVNNRNLWIRIGRQSNGIDTPLVTVGNNSMAAPLVDASFYSKSTIYLKIKRTENYFTLSFSEDDFLWKDLKKDYLVPMSSDVEIFLVTLSNSNYIFSADFSDFSVTSRVLR